MLVYAHNSGVVRNKSAFFFFFILVAILLVFSSSSPSFFFSTHANRQIWSRDACRRIILRRLNVILHTPTAICLGTGQTRALLCQRAAIKMKKEKKRRRCSNTFNFSTVIIPRRFDSGYLLPPWVTNVFRAGFSPPLTLLFSFSFRRHFRFFPSPTHIHRGTLCLVCSSPPPENGFAFASVRGGTNIRLNKQI